MDYRYSKDYGKGDHPERDKAVEKGLAQIAKEDAMPFARLCAKIRHEADVIARQARRQWYGGYPIDVYYTAKGVDVRDPKTGQRIPLADWWRITLARDLGKEE